ncbi:P-loop containing nucleoside triphosphate hydrolase protein [Lipomyces kononenkoae]|uniref:P-loop containing nucleoside triphosphate hydrolase protein n=1 Tax=Lipomyces kononenkoae TaxID=34357 RepID=A0ACC3SVP3_LIPKO
MTTCSNCSHAAMYKSLLRLSVVLLILVPPAMHCSTAMGSEWIETALNDAYGGLAVNTHYRFFQSVKKQHPNSQILSLQDISFNLYGYLESQNITIDSVGSATQHTVLERRPQGRRHPFHGPMMVDEDGEQLSVPLSTTLKNGVIQAEYSSTHFTVYDFNWIDSHERMRAMFLVFEGADDNAGKALVQDVYRWMETLKDEIWVFDEGHWQKDKDMYRDVQSADWRNIVLDSKMLQDLQRDTSVFFSSEEVYKSLNVVWKRGVLLLGPPGNGKTEAIKAIIKGSSVPCLYVKTFQSFGDHERGIRTIFRKARRVAPAILILEDLDSLVRPETRSFFLNELDGLESNQGILTIGTTNHPENIDPAILNRPSRFDTKYVFNLPDLNLRTQYIQTWLLKLESGGVRLVDDQYPTVGEFNKEISKQTEGWSFAYLKELFVSFQLTCAALRAAGSESAESVNAVPEILRHVENLSKQVVIGSEPEIEQGKSHLPSFGRRHARVARLMEDSEF